MRAAQDRLVPASASALISALKPGAEVVEMDAPHGLLQAVPLQAAQMVRDFVRRIEKD
jgi:pimeloyl-[acyl-carrier protein] methyl ester esterase